LLVADLAPMQVAINAAIQVSVTQWEYDALCCFAYNLGAHSLTSSTLMRKLNEGDSDAAADEFLKWDHAGGVRVAGLTRRRGIEREMFLHNVYPHL
jgi:lysozyme